MEGSGVSEVQAAFVTTLATMFGSPATPIQQAISTISTLWSLNLLTSSESLIS